MRKIPDEILNQAYLIQFKEEDKIDGFQVLLHSSQVGAYPNNTYVVGKEHLKLLKKADIPFKIITE